MRSIHHSSSIKGGGEGCDASGSDTLILINYLHFYLLTLSILEKELYPGFPIIGGAFKLRELVSPQYSLGKDQTWNSLIISTGANICLHRAQPAADGALTKTLHAGAGVWGECYLWTVFWTGETGPKVDGEAQHVALAAAHVAFRLVRENWVHSSLRTCHNLNLSNHHVWVAIK